MSQEKFSTLDQFLAQGKWKEADRETNIIMCKIMGREQEGWLTYDNCINFPPEELSIIDQLWVKYSQGKFGFCVQKQIWLECGGQIGQYDYEIYKKLGRKVGWLKTITKKTHLGLKEWEKEKWKSYSELTFNPNAPIGHLPSIVGVGRGSGNVGVLRCLRCLWLFGE
jgi:hypothetical protein